MGEQLLTEATMGLSGPLGALIAVIAILAFGAMFIVWRHVEGCKAEMRTLHQRVSAVKDDVSKLKGEDIAKLKEDVAYIRAVLGAHLDRFREEQKQ